VLRLSRDVARARPELTITTAPEPRAAGSTLVCPDLALSDGTRTRYLELVGFWTTEYLARKLARYREAGLEFRLCINDARSCADDDPPVDPCIVRFTKRVDAESVLADWPG
jgi:hypothetical protein